MENMILKSGKDPWYEGATELRFMYFCSRNQIKLPVWNMCVA